MKIALGMRLIEGPWGGGMQFGKAFAAYFKEQGNDVLFDLHDPGIDKATVLTSLDFSGSFCTFDVEKS